MKLIFAQGNPGIEYKNTRHNIGFQIVDAYADKHNLSFTDKTKFFASVAEGNIQGEKVLLVKPLTFYNDTGKSARSLIDFYKLTINEDVLVIHDDIALPFGTIRTREKGSDGGNNGIRSLNAHLGQEFKRIRIGMQTELSHQIDAATFVLGNLTNDEQATVTKDILPEAMKIIDTFIEDSFTSTSI